MKLPVAFIFLIAKEISSEIVLPRIFKDGMVLQQEPRRAHIYGRTDSSIPVNVFITCLSGQTYTVTANIKGAVFSAFVGPVNGGEKCQIRISQGLHSVQLQNVVFGDVWICSGQSNMQWPLSKIDNSEQEIEESSSYLDIRMYHVRHAITEEPLDDLLRESRGQDWFDVTNRVALEKFSAVCFLTARQITDFSDGDKHSGLIHSSWPATCIEGWSSREALDSCGFADTERTLLQNTGLYNAMVHPLTKLTIKGVLWYQGECNAGYRTNEYSCSFQNLIKSWRNTWSQNSDSDPEFPFGFVQIGPWMERQQDYRYPQVRWHQTGDFGYVPNQNLKNVFMAVAVDTFDAVRGIHPGDKKTVGYRLAVAAMNQVYGKSEYPLRGPTPAHIFVYRNVHMGNPTVVVKITFRDGTFKYRPAENSGFYFCSLDSDVSCDGTPGSWQLVVSANASQLTSTTLNVRVPLNATTLAYLWRESPIITPRGAPIYGDDNFGLPAAPFKFSIKLGYSKLP